MRVTNKHVPDHGRGHCEIFINTDSDINFPHTNNNIKTQICLLTQSFIIYLNSFSYFTPVSRKLQEY